jgi:hypothetical protein
LPSPLEFSLGLEEFYPQALCRCHESRLVSRIGLIGLLDEAVGILCPVGDGVYGAFEDLSVCGLRHRRGMVDGVPDGPEPRPSCQRPSRP